MLTPLAVIASGILAKREFGNLIHRSSDIVLDSSKFRLAERARLNLRPDRADIGVPCLRHRFIVQFTTCQQIDRKLLIFREVTVSLGRFVVDDE